MSNVSYSRIDKYDHCPFAYKLQYIDNIKIESTNIALVFGNATHHCEEKIANAIKDGKQIDYIKYKNEFIAEMLEIQNNFPKEFITPDKTNKTYKEKMYDYLEHGIYRLENFMTAHPTYKIVAAEANFTNVEILGVKFRGAIDRVILDTATGNYILHDIKSWAEPKKPNEIATPLQFLVYAEAAKILFGADPEKISCTYDLPYCDLYQEAGTSGWLTRGKEKLQKLFDGINSKDFKPTRSPLCAWCPYSSTNPDANYPEKYTCPYHSLWTRDERNSSDIHQSEFVFNNLEEYPMILEAYLNSKGVDLNESVFLKLLNKK